MQRNDSIHDILSTLAKKNKIKQITIDQNFEWNLLHSSKRNYLIFIARRLVEGLKNQDSD